MKIKIGIIGLGRMGTYHARVAQLIPDLEIIAIADPVLNIIDDLFTITPLFFLDYKELFELVDAVIIAAPTFFHYQIAKDALNYGLHVLLEKPIAPTLDQAKKLFDLAFKKKRVLQIGHVERFNPAFIAATLMRDSKRSCFIESKRNNIASSRLIQDSIILDLMIHDIDLVLQYINLPVNAINIIKPDEKGASDSTATAEILFENQSRALFYASKSAIKSERIMNIHFNDTDQLHLNFTQQTITKKSGPCSSFSIKNNPLLKQCEHFVDRIKRNEYQNNIEHELLVLKTTLELQRQFFDL